MEETSENIEVNVEEESEGEESQVEKEEKELWLKSISDEFNHPNKEMFFDDGAKRVIIIEFVDPLLESQKGYLGKTLEIIVPYVSSIGEIRSKISDLTKNVFPVEDQDIEVRSTNQNEDGEFIWRSKYPYESLEVIDRSELIHEKMKSLTIKTVEPMRQPANHSSPPSLWDGLFRGKFPSQPDGMVFSGGNSLPTVDFVRARSTPISALKFKQQNRF